MRNGKIRIFADNNSCDNSYEIKKALQDIGVDVWAIEYVEEHKERE